MRFLIRLIFVFGLALLGQNVGASEGIEEVVQLQKAGVDQAVTRAFIESSSVAYDPSAAEIQQMEDAGVPASIIIAVIDHGKQLRGDSDGDHPTESTLDTGTATINAPPDDHLNVSFFYEAMSPYGTWHSDETYGWVWQPNEIRVHADWRPYVNAGHWVWTDHGWYWESDYPWGWAGFHYGRWHHSPEFSWVWVPDTVWGPSWVAWRHSDDYYGWAPLPPEARFEANAGFSFRSKHVGFDFGIDFGLGEQDFTFVPVGSFLEADLSVHRISEERVRNAFNQTTIVKNTYAYNDNRVINNGLPVTQVSARTNRKIETVQVADANFRSGQAITRGEQRSGNKIMAYRPSIRNSAPETPRAVIQRQQASGEKAAQRKLQEETKQPRRTPAPTTSAGSDRATTQTERANTERSARDRLIQEKAQRRTREEARRSIEQARQPGVRSEPPPKAVEPTIEKRSEEPRQMPRVKEEPKRPVRESEPRAELDDKNDTRSESGKHKDR